MSELSSKSIISPNHTMYAEHVLYDPFSKEDMEGNNIRKYIPVSPHNWIMYFLVMFKEAEMYHLLQYLLLKDQGTDEPNKEYETHEIPIPKKEEDTQGAILSEVYVVRRRGRLAPHQPLSVCALLPAYEENRHLRPLGNLGHRLRRPRWID